MSNEEIRGKILKFLNLRRRAGIPVENRVRYLPSMIGISVEEFESNVEFLHQQRYVDADAALRLDGSMSYFRIELLEKGAVRAEISEFRKKQARKPIKV